MPMPFWQRVLQVLNLLLSVKSYQGNRMKFLQVHTFYQAAIDELYSSTPGLAARSFAEQTEALVRDGFSGIHMFAPYMGELGYEGILVVANNPFSQLRWLKENNIAVPSGNIDFLELVRVQVETIKPEILYLSDPITFNGDFIASLSFKPELIIGWRAANIPESINWKGFDLMFSNLDALRQAALTLGVKNTEHFFPGFPVWIYDEIKQNKPQYDVVFCGQVSFRQHKRRNSLLHSVASEIINGSFSGVFYLSGNRDAMTKEMAEINRGSRYGIAMHRALRSGRIAIDARGDIGLVGVDGRTSDLAGKQTSNMRIFEATGSGVMLLTEDHENLREYFEPGVEIETFKDEAELIDKINFYVKYPEKREEIARRGHERCLNEYSMAVRCRAFDTVIGRYCSNRLKRVSGNNSVFLEDDEKKMVDLAFEELSRHRNLEALAAFDKAITMMLIKKISLESIVSDLVP